MSKTRWWFKLAAGVLGVVLVGVAVYNVCCVYCRAPTHLKLSGGNVCPLRSQMARHICREVHDSGIVLEKAADTNSESIVADVDARRIDLGLTLGGLPPDSHPNVRQVAALGVNPLHLLVRSELADGDAATFHLLRGQRVSLGERGSNGALLAERLVRFAGLEPSSDDSPGDFIAEYPREGDLHRQLRTIRYATGDARQAALAKLPDAVFLVDSLPSPLVDELVTVAGYRLVPLPYATALHLDHRRDQSHAEVRLESSRLEATTIPAFTYGVDPPMPATDCQTFGLRLLLVAHKDTPATAITRLLRALDGGIARHYHIPLDTANHHHEFPIHPGAEAFAASRQPVVVGEMLEPAGDALSILGAGAAGALALWGFMRGLRRVNPDVHLRQIDRIERLLQGREQDESAPTMPREFIEHLEARLAQVKESAIEDYAMGRLESDEALIGILTLIADTRHLLVQRRKQLGQQGPCAPARPTRLSDAA